MRVGFKSACGIQFKATPTEGIVEGYGATWDRDNGGDRFEKGSFSDVIASDFPAGRIKIYREHRVAIGVPVDLREDDTGLWVSAKVNPGDSLDGDETLRLADSSVYDAFSVGYQTDPATVTYVSEGGQRTRVIGRVAALPHIGILGNPMNPAAAIEAVKGQQELVDYEKKGLFSFAEAVHALAIVEDIRRWGELDETEAAIAQQLLDEMAAASEAIKSQLPTDSGPTLPFLVAQARALKEVAAQRKKTWQSHS